jgi:hypothetical protein
MNNARPKTKLFRGIAAATLVVWLVAQMFCTIHCASGKVSLASASGKGCCHKTDHSSKPGKESTCPAIKLLAAKTTADQGLVAPDALQPAAAVLLVQIISLLNFESPSIDRPTHRPERVIAHEVSLGSEARSHAPPSLG